ncbi:MAG: hypothetical protein A2Y56_04305 [Candidatus Aminicenantes bacterium RBG_13_63_10]|nr:MAG: hypothetical protein A2Y56_04305 [Candidatus Aminicenantes bacterium RBG_13_63_10]
MMRKRWVGVCLGALAVLAGAGLDRIELQAGPAISVGLKANPMTYNGECPVQVQFSIGFKVTGPCTINYHFINDKNQKSETSTLNCPAAGSYQASKTITVTDKYIGWVAVQVTSPVSVQSNQVALQIKCKPKPTITSAALKYGGSPIPEMDIIGASFGSSQGTKSIKIDGTLIAAMPGWSVLHWGETLISFSTSGVTPWEHTYQLAVTEGSTTISNIYSARFLYKIDAVNPNSGGWDTTVQVNVWSLPPSQGTYFLRLGPANSMPIQSWGGGSISAKVPNGVAPGTYDLYLQKGADIVSTKVPFTVTSQAFISKVNWLSCNIHQSQLSVSLNGSNFGASQGTKQVKIGTLPGWAASHWSNDLIEAQGPFNIVPWTQTYPVTIGDGAQTVSNTVQHRFPYRLVLEGVSGNPVQLPAGSTLNISVHGLPLTQGGLVLKLWNEGTAYPIEVLSWISPNIQIRVPHIVGISGKLDIFDGGLRASDASVGFKII